MCLFRKKKKEEIVVGNKYRVGEGVSFKHRDDFIPGTVIKVHKLNEEIVYDVQVGGECPYIRENIAEKDIKKGVR